MLGEGREDLAEGPAQVAFHDLADGGKGLGGHLVPQQLELGDQLLGENARSGRQDLSELDVGRPSRSKASRSRLDRPRRGQLRAAHPAGLAPLEHIPAADGQAEDAADSEDPPPGRDPAAPEQLGNLGGGGGPQHGRARPPDQPLGVDQPRRGVAEGPDSQVGRLPERRNTGLVGHRHTRDRTLPSAIRRPRAAPVRPARRVRTARGILRR